MATERLPKAERRRQIAQEALRLLAERGPAGLTLHALGDALGVSDAALLRHFKDKREIVHAAIDHFGALLSEDLPDDIEDPVRRLGAFFVRRLTKVRQHKELLQLVDATRLRDVAGDDAALVDAHVARSAQFIRACIQEAQAQGLMRQDIPPRFWMWMITGLMRGSAREASLLSDHTEPMSPERTWELLEALLKARG